MSFKGALMRNWEAAGTQMSLTLNSAPFGKAVWQVVLRDFFFFNWEQIPREMIS